MWNIELNKIAAAFLVAGLIALVVGNVTDILYEPGLQPPQRGFKIATSDIEENSSSSQVEKKLVINIGELMANADINKGANIFKKCATCHTVNENGINKVGPNLWGVINAKKGFHPDFKYSTALNEKGGKWNYAELFHFLYKPQKYIKGTKMSFIGLNKPEEIADVVAYLREFSSSKEALPAKDEILEFKE